MGHPRCTIKTSRYQRVSLVYTCIIRLWLHFSYLWKRKTKQNVSDIMNDYWVTENDVGEAAVAAFIEIYGGRMESNLTKVRYNSWLCFFLTSCWRQTNALLSKGWERLQYLYSFFVIQSKSLQKLLNNFSWCPWVIQTAIVYR